ncbi:MAG: NAD(P)-binding protein [Bacteroidales bacterium]|jgi:all-trans-retinol 13,14-reductase
MYDIVIVGSGLGGLLCGYILSKEGYRVCIVEKNKQLGGCLQTFKRDNCIFDTGMHYVGSMDEGQMLWRFFKYFDLLGKVKMKRLDDDVFDLIYIEGEEYKYAQGYDNFIETLLHYFPKEKESLVTYINKFKEIRQSLGNFSSDEYDLSNTPSMKYYSINTFDFIKSITSDIKLQNVLGASNSFYTGKAESSPLYAHAIINNSFLEGSWRFVDGGGQIADILANSIIANGGVIIKNAKVKKFVMNPSDEFVESIEIEKQEPVYGKYFISNMHPVETFNKVESKLIRKVFVNRLRSIENSISVFSLYIVLKEDSFKYINYNYYHYKHSQSWGPDIYDSIKWPGGYMFYTPASSKSEVYADSISVMTYMKYDEVKQWENTTVEKRGEEYIEFKRKKAEQLLDVIEEKFPAIRSCIKSYFTSTPLTYRDYTATVNGSMYGMMKDCNNSLRTLITPGTKIPNLFLTGQNINLHGVLGVTMGAMLTCGGFVGTSYLFNKVNNA